MRRWRSQSEQGGSHDEAKRKQHCWVFFRSNKQRVGNVWSVCEGEEGGVNRLNNRGIISELFHCCLLSSRSLCLGVGVGNKDKTSLSALQPCHGQCVMPNSVSVWTHSFTHWSFHNTADVSLVCGRVFYRITLLSFKRFLFSAALALCS